MKIRMSSFEIREVDTPLEHQFRQAKDPSRVRRFRATDDTVDRYGEVVLARGVDFSNFAKAPRLMQFHEYNMWPIGKIVAAGVVGEEMLMDAEFDPAHIDEQADMILAKIDHETVNTGSIGFIPAEGGIAFPSGKNSDEEKDLFERYPGVRRIYTKWELLEFSIVPIPANPNAVLSALQKDAQRRFGPDAGNDGMAPEPPQPSPEEEDYTEVFKRLDAIDKKVTSQ